MFQNILRCVHCCVERVLRNLRNCPGSHVKQRDALALDDAH